MKLEQFDEFVQPVLENLSDRGQYEYYDTDQSIARDLLDHARSVIFSGEIAEQAEYNEYLRLKAKFDPKSDDRLMENLDE